MKHLRLMIVAAVLALTADPVSAAPAKHHKKVVAMPSEAALAKDLIYACAPEAANLVAFDQSTGITLQDAKYDTAGAAVVVSRQFSEYKNNPSGIDGRIKYSASSMKSIQDVGPGSTVSSVGFEGWLYLNCMFKRSKMILNGAALITRHR